MKQTSVTRSTMETYHIQHQGEWATIAVKGWQATGNDNTPREIGEILINSSYGAWAYQWGHLGLPFKNWLAKTEDSRYIAEKFLGTKARVFDGEKTVRELRRRLIEWRRQGDLDKDAARAIWGWIEEYESELESSDHEFCDRMFSGPRDCECERNRKASRFFEEPWEHMATSMDRSFASFWRVIWPVFQQELQRELMPAAA